MSQDLSNLLHKDRLETQVGLNWPAISSVNGDMSDEAQVEVKQLLDDFGDAVARRLTALGLRLHASPFFRPFSLVAVKDSKQILIGLSSTQGMSQLTWLDQPDLFYAPSAMQDMLENQLGWPVSAILSLPLPHDTRRSVKIEEAAATHSEEMDTMNALRKLGDIGHVQHLKPYLRDFLEDHPEPSRNVFIMMRFGASEQMKEIHDAIVSGLADHGMNAVRADDRDYTGELWSNIEVYLTGCHYGIAVFEDIEQRDYNPNVSLELGYLMGRGKRTLLLKEKRLPNMPSDVVHRLYKEFDSYEIEKSVKREVGTWISRDLRI